MSLKTLKVSELMLDEINPRHHEMSNEREIISWFANSRKAKLKSLIHNIAEYGWDSSKIPIVIRANQDGYTVIDGNRRIAAIKLLRNPALVDNNQLKAFANKCKSKAKNVPKSLLCLIKANRADCKINMERNHKGENDGIGQVTWGTIETARYNQEIQGHPGRHATALGVIEYLQNDGQLTEDEIENFPITTLDRVLNSRIFKKLVGYRYEQGKLLANINPKEASKPIRRLVVDLKNKRIKVDDVKSAQKIQAYYEGLDEAHKPSDTTPLSEPRAMLNLQQMSSRRRQKSPGSPQRSKLVRERSNLTIPIDQTRAHAIFEELKKLSVRNYPNATAALFRIFMDLSVQTYQRNILKQSRVGNTGTGQVIKVAEDLKSRGNLTQNQTEPIVTASKDKENFLSIASLSSYMHNPENHPTADDLIRKWDSYEPFLKALWCQLGQA